MAQDKGTSPAATALRTSDLNIRNYGVTIDAVAAQWFRKPIQNLDVRPRGLYSPTADGACEVDIPACGLIGFVKPHPERPNHSVVAREKIASDLGYVLGLPVSPVVVRAPMAGWPDFTALSLNCLRSGRLWGAGGAAHIERLAPGLESLRIFWTWIGDVDHNGHGANLSWQIENDAGHVSSFDHSYSLGHDGAHPATIPACQGYGTATMAEVQAARETVMDCIEAMPREAIETIVCRLGWLLTEPEQKRILRILEERRGELRRLIG